MQDADRQYTDNTLILMLEPGTTDQAVDALAAAYGMEVIYRYQSFSSCAVRLSHSLDDAGFAALIERLEAEPCVISAQRDGILHLDNNSI